jgi:hypothetical protein
LAGALVVSPLIVSELLRVSLEVVDDNEGVVEEARSSNDGVEDMGDEVQGVADNGEKGAAVMSGGLDVDWGAAISEVDTG